MLKGARKPKFLLSQRQISQPDKSVVSACMQACICLLWHLTFSCICLHALHVSKQALYSASLAFLELLESVSRSAFCAKHERLHFYSNVFLASSTIRACMHCNQCTLAMQQPPCLGYCPFDSDPSPEAVSF